MSDQEEETRKLTAAIAGLEAQRVALGDAVVGPAIAALRQQLSQLGAIAEEAADEERKIVTVLFVDITGFTALAEKLDPEEARTLVNRCFEYLVPVVQKYEGTIDKFIGDEIMALFGAPLAHEDDPERALRAALGMMEAIAEFNRAHGTSLDLHIGINTGPVIAGRIGTEDHRDYSVMGDAVNLAARLEDASSAGEIFVGPNTYRRTAALFEFETLPAMRLKGKAEAIGCYRLIEAKAAPKPTRGIEGLHAPLIGRDAEIADILSAIAALEEMRGSIFAITGDAGFGKSRLLAEARAHADGKVRWAEGRALSYTVGISFSLARDLLLNLLDLKSDAPPAAVAAALRKSLAQHFGEEMPEVYPYLARAFELPLEPAMEDRVQFLSADALRARMLQAFQDYVLACAGEHPLVLVWEDLHWSDSSSLELLECIMPLTARAPLLLLCAARPEEGRVLELLARAAETHPSSFHRVRLQPLTRSESSSLVQQLLRIENLPSAMRDLILDRAEGNPFFLEELLRSLLDSGAVVLQENGAVATRELRSIDIPDTLQGVLAARIDRLPRPDKHALQNASVIGRIFQDRILSHLYDPACPEERLVRALCELQKREFIQSGEQTGSETAPLQKGEYIFKHAVTHQVAYGSMLMTRRRAFHKATAETIEKLFPERIEDLAATLGFHYERADAPLQAVRHLAKAAQSAQETFANTEALAFYRSALAQIERLSPAERQSLTGISEARLHEGVADVLTLIGEQIEAREGYERARSAVAPAEIVQRSRLYRKTGLTHSAQRHYEEAARAYDAAEKELGAQSDISPTSWWEEKVQIQLDRMHLLYWQGKAGEIMELADQYRPVVERNGTPLQRGRFFQMLALSLLTGSRYQPSEECVKLAARAVEQSEGASNLSEVAHVRFVFGFAHLWRGNFAEATQHCEDALALAQRCGNLVLQARCLNYLAAAHRCAHQVDEARDFATRTISLATQLRMIEYVAMARANLAWVAWRDGDFNRAEELGREALRLWHGMEDPYGFDWMAIWPLVAVALEAGDLARAIEHASGLLAEGQHPLPPKLSAATRRVLEAWEKTNPERARSDLVRAMEIAQEFGQL